MPSDDHSSEFGIIVFSELLASEQLFRAKIDKLLPKGMELSHFMVLNILANKNEEVTPAQLSKRLNVTKGAITNTVKKLEQAGFIHIRTDWDDARKKWISLSQSGRLARDSALATAEPELARIVENVGFERLRQVLPVLRDLRQKLG